MSEPKANNNDKVKKTKVNLDKESPSQQVQALTEALQRERADSVNMRRQFEQSLASSKRIAIINVVRQLLPAIDNLERALKHTPPQLQDSDYVKGIQGVVRQFDRAFKDLGIVKIVTVGQTFDPKYHEAVHLDEASGGSKEIVCEELQSGYLIDDEVIRHAMVNVRLEK